MFRKRMCAALAAVLIAPAIGGPAFGQAAEAPAVLDATILSASRTSPEAFVRALLNQYSGGNAPLEDLPDNQAFFSTSTAALIQHVVTKNEEGAFDADPFCDCQDWSSLKVKTIDATLPDASHAAVRVSLSGDRTFTQRYMLVKEADGWRVADIVHPTYGSMVKRLAAR